MNLHTQSKFVITPQDTRSYDASLNEWLPETARTLADQGDLQAERLVIIWRRYRMTRDPGDWRCFVVARRLFVQENGE